MMGRVFFFSLMTGTDRFVVFAIIVAVTRAKASSSPKSSQHRRSVAQLSAVPRHSPLIARQLHFLEALEQQEKDRDLLTTDSFISGENWVEECAEQHLEYSSYDGWIFSDCDGGIASCSYYYEYYNGCNLEFPNSCYKNNGDLQNGWDCSGLVYCEVKDVDFSSSCKRDCPSLVRWEHCIIDGFHEEYHEDCKDHCEGYSYSGGGDESNVAAAVGVPVGVAGAFFSFFAFRWFWHRYSKANNAPQGHVRIAQGPTISAAGAQANPPSASQACCPVPIQVYPAPIQQQQPPPVATVSQLYTVVVPEGVPEGGTFHVVRPDGAVVMVPRNPGQAPGTQVTIML